MISDDIVALIEGGVPMAVATRDAQLAFTLLFNACGNPSMSVPLTWSRNGLPIGVKFAAAFGDEGTLFRLGAQLEAAEPWAHRRPAAPARAERATMS